MLLARWNAKLLAETFKLPDMEAEIERAVEQVEAGIKAGEERREEKEEVERATTAPMEGAAEREGGKGKR